jgi:CheY-like chemotaxis protein
LKAANIVEDLLTLTRRGVTVQKIIDMNQIVSDYLKSPEFNKLLSFHLDVKVTVHLENDPLYIVGSPVHISKTVMNLVSNAAESMPVGGEITISTQNMHIDSPIRGYDEVMEGAYAMISVSDSGVGISPEDMSRIFEPFYTKKTMGRSGTGLGMAVVWGTVKDHHGYIDIESKEGCGTTFSLYFPLSQNETQDDQPVFSVKNIMGKGESILVVDDVEEQRHIASKILEVLGYTVETVPSGEEAVEYLKGKNADLLVLDMIMAPGMDGLETYMNIIERNPKQKAIIVSGYSADDRVKKTQDLGAGQYVKKPYTLETLGTAVRKELNK